jgi:transcriptional antiterminator RfaH
MSAWFAVHCQPLAEQRAAANLRRQGYETYLPLYRRRRSHARRVELVERPLFPRYLFVRFDPAVDRWRPILSTFGVCGLVRIGDTPLPVPTRVVEALQRGQAERMFDESLEPSRKFTVGAGIRVLAGPFADLVGKFQGLADAERVVVLLDLLGREVRVRLPSRAVAAA